MAAPSRRGKPVKSTAVHGLEGLLSTVGFNVGSTQSEDAGQRGICGHTHPAVAKLPPSLAHQGVIWAFLPDCCCFALLSSSGPRGHHFAATATFPPFISEPLLPPPPPNSWALIVATSGSSCSPGLRRDVGRLLHRALVGGGGDLAADAGLEPRWSNSAHTAQGESENAADLHKVQGLHHLQPQPSGRTTPSRAIEMGWGRLVQTTRAGGEGRPTPGLSWPRKKDLNGACAVL